jgi:dienelactone hydrolase
MRDWHIAGFFDSDIAVDPHARLFQKKISDAWVRDHLAPWGGCEKAPSALEMPCESLAAAWDLAPLDTHPILSLRRAAEEFPEWEARMRGLDPDSWSKLYYALALVESPRELEAELLFSGWDGCRLWVNGRLVFEEHSYHHVILDMERLPVRLLKGVNTFLFQLDRDGAAARIVCPSRPSAVAALRSVAVRPRPAGRDISTFAQLRRYAESLEVRMPFRGKTKADLMRWRRKFLRHYRECLGPAPVRPDSSAGWKLVEETARDGYTRRRYHLRGEAGGIVPCYVLIPDGNLYNGRTLVVAHGHESHFERVAGADSDAERSAAYFHNYGERLAKKGFLVAVMCERCFSERRDPFEGGDACNAAHRRAEAMGLTLPRLHIADLHILYDLVVSLPAVNAGRIGITGLSGGGTLSYLAGAFDGRFKAVAPFCGMCRYREYALGGGCGMQIVPRLYPTGDVGEVLSLIAPRPLLIAQGRLDSTFNVIEARSIAEDARRAYRAAGVEDRIELRIYERPHQYDPDVAEQFFLKWL